MLNYVAQGGTDADALTTLASRLARLQRDFSADQLGELKELADGKSFADLAHDLLHACDPDAQAEKAKTLPGIVGAPTEEQVKAAAEQLAQAAVTPFLKAQIRGQTRPGINGPILKRAPVSLPPTAEQDAIVEAVEDQLSVIDHLESDLAAKLTSAQALRQSILRHAFSGKLVPQDPKDEPASELLKRIAAEREQRAREAAAAKRANGHKPLRPGKPHGKTPRVKTTKK